MEGTACCTEGCHCQLQSEWQEGNEYKHFYSCSEAAQSRERVKLPWLCVRFCSTSLLCPEGRAAVSQGRWFVFCFCFVSLCKSL